MRTLLTSFCIFALTLAAQGEQPRKAAVAARRGGGHAVAHVQTNRAMATHRFVNSGARVHTQRNFAVNRTRVHSVNTATRHRTVTTRNNHVANLRAQNTVQANRARNVTINRQNNFAINRQQNVVSNRRGVVTNNWRNARFRGANYAAFQNYRRSYHNRSWWHRHYNRIVFVSGGWWYWNSGYWYPAWGYAPGAYYPYDGPIYGYSDLGPDQVVISVQTQLQDNGYYSGPIDGVLGRQTRAALAAFQADHGLAVTSAIDQPTLGTMGLS